MIIFYACNLGGRANQVWVEGAWIRWPGESISGRDAVILCGCEDHTQGAMIASSQRGWD